jgi:hypothetical protein
MCTGSPDQTTNWPSGAGGCRQVGTPGHTDGDHDPAGDNDIA